jgi:hypothetical protein
MQATQCVSYNPPLPAPAASPAAAAAFTPVHVFPLSLVQLTPRVANSTVPFISFRSYTTPKQPGTHPNLDMFHHAEKAPVCQDELRSTTGALKQNHDGVVCLLLDR